MDNGVAKTPPRGFSTWNAFPVHSIDEATCYSYMNSIVQQVIFYYLYFLFSTDARRLVALRHPTDGMCVA